MPAAITDKFNQATNGTRPVPTTLTATRAIGASSITVGALTGWPTATAVHFSIYQVDTSGNKVAGSQTDWKGTASGTTISNLTLEAGSDSGDSVGAIVECGPTAAWANDVVDGILVSHDQDGTLKDGAVDAASVLASNVVTTAKIADDAVTAAKLDGVDKSLLSTDSNPYKFSVYRSAAKAAVATTETKVEFDAELFDTNNNFDTTNFRYTAPVSGFYHFDWGFGVSVITPSRLFSTLYKNNSPIQRSTDVASSIQGVSCSCLVQATAGDYFEIFYYSSTAGGTYASSTYKDTHFSGFLVSRT